MTILIVGAGLTGLTAGARLAENGEKCLLVEKESAVGGLCRSLVLDDIVFDLGPHVFFIDPSTPAGRFTREILKDTELISRRFAYAVRAGDRYWAFPNHFDFFFYPWKYKKHVISSLLRKRPPPGDGAVSAERDLSMLCGPEFYELVFKDLFQKKTLLPPDELHHHWLIRVDRTVSNELEPFHPEPKLATVRRILSKLREEYYYPKEGIGALPNLIWERYKKAGGETILNCGAIALQRAGNRIVSAAVGGKTFEVKNVVWTAPVSALNAALGEDLPRLPCVSMRLILLTYNRKLRVKRPYVYTYHPDPALIFNRIYYPESIYRESSPADKEGICLEFNFSESMKRMSNDELISRATQDVEMIGLFKASDLRQKRLIELDEAMPVYGMDYQTRMSETYAAVRATENLQAVGRQGGFFFCLSPGAVSQGIKISDHLLTARKEKETVLS